MTMIILSCTGCVQVIVILLLLMLLTMMTMTMMMMMTMTMMTTMTTTMIILSCAGCVQVWPHPPLRREPRALQPPFQLTALKPTTVQSSLLPFQFNAVHYSAVQPAICHFLHTCMICASKRLHINTQMAINIFWDKNSINCIFCVFIPHGV